MKRPMTNEEWMDMALDLARKGDGKVPGRPLVGCVIVDADNKIGEGFFDEIGGDHAEIKALNEAGANAKGATMYVTLEPHCIFGLTPPCTKAIIKAGIRKVFVAIEDPFPNIQGRGVEEMKAAGIEVIVGLREEQANELNKEWLVRNKRMF
jgi:diaminohydroxyphosphoribosylaminopyrimidine deaminase/5-amino-6-(5-phosphoribosylamino)uracil reductase